MAFVGSWALIYLGIEHAGLTTMPPLDPIKQHLKRLYLRHNCISVVPSAYFKGFDYLQEVFLPYNILNTFPEVTPLSHSLRHLRLGNNQIQDIPQYFYMTKFSYMNELSLPFNQISSFDYDSILAWPSLPKVVLQFNKIKLLPDIPQTQENCSQTFRGICLLNLSGNPIDCNCKAASIIQENATVYGRCIYLKCPLTISLLIRCASPPHLHGRMLTDLSKSSFPCAMFSPLYVRKECFLTQS